jgi:hypothetical protein
MEYAENNLPEEERYHRSGEQHDYFSSNLKKLHQKHLDLNSIKQASYAMNQTQNTHLNTCNKECDHESDNCYESFFETIEASIV